MKRLTLLSLLGLALTGQAHAIPASEAERLADAIYRIEGGKKARKPYGILSIPVKSEAHARRICLNTIRNNWKRWEAAGRPGCYVEFLARRYCPPSTDPIGHQNWLNNARQIFGRVKEA